MTKILFNDILDILDPDNDLYIVIAKRYLKESTDQCFTEVRFLNFIVHCYLSIKDKWTRMALSNLLKLLTSKEQKANYYSCSELKFVSALFWYSRNATSMNNLDKKLKDAKVTEMIRGELKVFSELKIN